MPLPLPTLDNRDFDQLVAEAGAMLPRLSPGWTDYNASDPGITLLELLAARTESAIYRLDRTPPSVLRAFLRLVDVSVRPAQVADTVVAVSASNAPFLLPTGIQVSGQDVTCVFQTAEALQVSPARLVSVLTPGADVTSDNGSGRAYHPFGHDSQPPSALYLGFDQPLGNVGARVRLYAWSADPAGDRDVRAQLMAEYDAMVADAGLCKCATSATVPDWREHYSVRTVWEYHSGGGNWSALPDMLDETRALSLSGAVEFTVPADHQSGGPTAGLFFLRCRLVSGTYECPPRLQCIAHNTVTVRHAADVATEDIGRSAGNAQTRYELRARPVVPGSTTLTVTLPSGPDAGWGEVLDWDATGPHDRHYLLDSEHGTVACGNGAVGRVFPAQALLRIDYQVGGGAAGNIPAHLLDRVLPSVRNADLYQAANGGAVPVWSKLLVRQPYAAAGGVDAESLAAATARASEAAFAPSRAVTLDDFARLAQAVPGVPVGRAYALAEYHPRLPCIAAAGNVTVVAIPACPDYRPVPSADFLAAIERYLNRRRMLTAEVHLSAPCYTTVIVHASLQLGDRADGNAVRILARAALERLFHPLHGGPDGNGWPVGRNVYRAEIMALLSKVPGVSTVTDLGLAGEDDAEPQCGNFVLCPDCMVRSGPHVLRVANRSPMPIIDRSQPHECP